MIMRCAIVLAMTLVISHAADYCKIKTCSGHTACNFKTTEPSSSCTGLHSQGLTATEKAKVLDAHNRLRQKVANGQEKRGNPGPQPASKDMQNLEWDDELELIAQRWANQCNWGHDQCRDVERFVVGQNIADIRAYQNINAINVESMVQDWYDEVKDFNSNDVASFKMGDDPMIGHYTQMVWAKTTKIGCGATKYTKEEMNTFYLVCNYGPAGNVLGQPIYTN